MGGPRWEDEGVAGCLKRRAEEVGDDRGALGGSGCQVVVFFLKKVPLDAVGPGVFLFFEGGVEILKHVFSNKCDIQGWSTN